METERSPPLGTCSCEHTPRPVFVELVTIYKCPSPLRSVLCWIITQAGTDGKPTEGDMHLQEPSLEQERR